MPDPKDTDQKKNIIIVGGDPTMDSIIKKVMTTKRIMDKIEKEMLQTLVMPPETMMPSPLFPSFSMSDNPNLNDNPNPSTYANQSSASSLSKEDVLEQIRMMERMLHEKCGFSDAMPSPARLGFHNFNKPITASPSIPLIPPLPPIHTNPYLTEQFRFPTSKKKRIRKKWSKDPRNFRPSRSVYVVNKGRTPGMAGMPGMPGMESWMFCHPMMEVAIADVVKKFNLGTT